ncbi:MAG: YihY/virulence factor BrkB family protein [Bacteroidota bacterium]
MNKVLLNHRKIKVIRDKLIERAEKVSLPFFDGVPLYDVALFFWRSIVDGSIATRASAIAFSFFIAFFPGVLFLFTLIPYIPIENFQDELFRLIQELLPEGTFVVVEDTIADILKNPRGGLLSLGFLMALIFSTNGIASMMSAFDATVHSINRRSWLSQRFAAIFLLGILSVLLTLAVSLLIGGEIALNYLKENDILRDSITLFFLNFGRWVIIVLLLFFANSFLYYMAPAKKTKWRFISAGSTVSTVLSVFALSAFTYYINNFSQYNKLYGSIGTLLIILFLMYIMAVILLIGFELNASIYQARTEKED